MYACLLPCSFLGICAWPHFERLELEVNPSLRPHKDDLRFLAFSQGEADLSFRSGFK